MSYQEERTTHVAEDVPRDTHETRVPHETHSETRVTRRSSPLRMIERAIIYLFGLIQLVIVLRIVLLLVAAREGNAIVAFVYDVSELFVAPFRGILGMNEVGAGQSALDVGAIVALVGWTIIELLILGLLRIARPARTA